MIFLYCTGTFLTLTRHDWLTWGFARNVTFNFFGFSMVVYGYRAVRLYRSATELGPTRLDYALSALLFVSMLALSAVALWKDTPMRVFAAMGLLLCVLEVRELRWGFKPREVLLRRHIRYMLASYFYMLTVVSIVHLGDELPGRMRWLWPTILGAFIIYFAGAKTPSVSAPGPFLRWAVGATLVIGLSLGAYVMFDLWSGANLSMQTFSR